MKNQYPSAFKAKLVLELLREKFARMEKKLLTSDVQKLNKE